MKKVASEAPRAVKMAAKERAIVTAARASFLKDGFAGASMDLIATSAGVSVKTIYSHFENKSELFSKVMIAACTDHLLSNEAPTDELLSERFAWFGDATQRGLTEAGKDYLRHLLSAEQLALYRVVTRDADRFPDLGRQYQRNVAQGRTRILKAYLERTTRKNSWGRRDSAQDAALYQALLRAGIYEEALHGLLDVRPHRIAKHARLSSEVMWQLLGSRCG